VDPKQARSALLQFGLWGIAMVAIGVGIAAGTWPHAGPTGYSSGDPTGFWFGLVLVWVGTMLTLVPLVAWGAKLAHEAWPSQRGTGEPVDLTGVPPGVVTTLVD
jgi:hypothetical protein